MVDVTMPQLGETVTEGTIIRWFKQVGDPVEVDEILFEISTDKVDSEVPAPVAGVVTEILAGEGDVVEVGQVLARIGSPGETPAPESVPAAESAPAAEPISAAASVPVTAPESMPAAEPVSGLEPAPASSDPAMAQASEQSSPPEPPSELAPAPESSAPEPSAPEPSAPEPSPEPAAVRAGAAGAMAKVLSPVVRRLIAENDLDPDAIVGTGLGGRVTRADVEAVIRARAVTAPAGAPPSSEPPAATPPAAEEPPAATPPDAGEPPDATLPAAAPQPAAEPVSVLEPAHSDPAMASDHPAQPPAPEPPPAAGVPAVEPSSAAETPPAAVPPARAPSTQAAPPATRPGDRVVRLNNIRRRTAEHMVMSKQTSPHVLTAIEIDYEGVEQVRRSHKASWKAEEGFSLTYLPFICRAVVDALREYPHLNATFGDGELIVHGSVNLAVAVDIDFDGLLAPVIKEADGKRLRQIARDVVDLAARARTKQLGLDDLTGGTFTLTNAGQYGTMMQFPIINQPQVAILSTDGVSRKPVVVTDGFGNESIAIHSVGVLAMAWDHRAFDGVYAAAFLHRVKEIIETRDWEAEVR